MRHSDIKEECPSSNQNMGIGVDNCSMAVS